MVRIAPHGWRWKKDKRLAGIKDPKLRAALKELRCASLNRKAVPLRSLTLCRLGPLAFRAHPEEIAKALGRLEGVEPLLAVLSEAGSTAAARRLAGAFLCRGDLRAAERILQGADHRGQG